jgi:hypothetical protein
MSKRINRVYTNALIILVVLIHRVIVVIKRTGRNADDLLQARHIYDCMSTSPWFASPSPDLTGFKTNIDLWEAAEISLRKREPGSKGLRDEKRRKVFLDEDGLKHFIQEISDSNPEQAVEIVNSSGMFVRAMSKFNKQDFTARSMNEGEAELASSIKGKRCAHEWQRTITPDKPDIWVTISITLQGKTRVKGLTSGTRVYFRHRKIFPDGMSDWDQTICIIIK